MRLIDADRLFHNLERGVRSTSNEVFREIANTPTVNAIPIEWIEEYRQNREDYADEYNAKAVLKRLLETWEKENEID